MKTTHGIIAVGAFVVLAAGITVGIVKQPTQATRTSQQVRRQNILAALFVSPLPTILNVVERVFLPASTSTPVATGVTPKLSANVNRVAAPETALPVVSNTNVPPTNTTVISSPSTNTTVVNTTPKNSNTSVPANSNTNSAPPASGGTTLHVEITFYGSYDNDPPGSRDISDPVLHQLAGGTGTYADPITFASPDGSGAYPVGTIIYVPRVQKYFIKEDTCATSWTAPNGCGPVSHVDLYMGNPSNSQAVLACEDALTPDGNDVIIVDPPSTLTYDPTLLWNQSTGACMTPHV